MSPVTCPELVGRAAELRAVSSALESALTGAGSCILIGGEAGIGKSRLVTEAVRLAGEGGFQILSGRCVDLSGGRVPFGPVVEAFRGLSRRIGVDAVRELVGPEYDELAAVIPLRGASSLPRLPKAPDVTQGWLFELLLTVLGRLGGGGPVLLVLEDLHWADHSTLDVVAFLSRAVLEEPVIILATYRSEELARGDALNTLVAELDRSRVGLVLSLDGLSREAMAAQLAGILGTTPLPEVVDHIYGLSDGNAFYAEELLALGSSTAEGLPARLQGLLMVRVETISPAARQRVRFVAAAGRPVDFLLLAALIPEGEDVAAATLREAVDHHVLNVDPASGRYDFRHALFREAVYQDLQPGERIKMHRAIAEVLFAQPALAVDGNEAGAAAELATHWLRAQDHSRALPAAVRAARLATQTQAHAAASIHYEQVLALWSRVVDAEVVAGVDRLQLLREAAAASGAAGDFARALHLVRAALDQAPPDAPKLLLGTLHSEVALWLWELGDGSASLQAGEEARRLLATEATSLEWAELLATDAGILVMRGRFAEAEDDAQRAVVLARELGNTDLESHALTTHGRALVLKGNSLPGSALLDQAVTVAQSKGSIGRLLRAHVLKIDSLDVVGAVEDTSAAIERALSLIQGTSVRHPRVILARDAMSNFLLRQGRWAEAKAMAEAVVQDRIAPSYTILAHLSLARMCTASGLTAAAEEHVAVAVTECEHDVDLQYQWRLHLALAELGLALGDVVRVRTAVANGLDLLGETDWLQLGASLCALGLRAEADVAQVGKARSAKDLSESRDSVERYVDRIRLIQSLGSEGDAFVFHETLVEIETAHCELSRIQGIVDPGRWAAVAQKWEGLGNPYPAAHAWWRHGEAQLQAGARKDAQSALRRGHESAGQLGATILLTEIQHLARRARIDLDPPAPTAPGVSNPLGLTSRELEVLPFLMKGETNRQIARSLVISEKTASVHVSNLMRKLGAANRAQAAAKAHHLGLG